MYIVSHVFAKPFCTSANRVRAMSTELYGISVENWMELLSTLSHCNTLRSGYDLYLLARHTATQQHHNSSTSERARFTPVTSNRF